MTEKTKDGRIYTIEMIPNCGIGKGSWGVYADGKELVKLFCIYSNGAEELLRAIDWIHSH